MKTKTTSTNTFNISEEITVICRAENTRYGFRHLATILQTGQQAKETYTNRTWERYEFETVLLKLASKIGGSRGDLIAQHAKDYQPPNPFGFIGVVAALGDILTDDQKDANDWKLRMIRAGLGDSITPPADWDTLTEDEKERRLDQVIEELRR